MVLLYRWVAIATLLIFTFGISSIIVEASDHSKSGRIEATIISHRGASGYAPEHTFPSYQLGDLMHGDYIEIDLQMTNDGELIAMHDETIDRTTNKNGLVRDFSLQEIKKLDAGSWFNEVDPEKADPAYVGLQVPTLREVLERFGKHSKFFIETKSPEIYPGMEEKLIDILNEYNLIGSQEKEARVMIQSFSVESLRKIHQLDGTVPLIQLLSYYAPASISESEIQKIKGYAIGVGLHFTAIYPNYIQKVTDAGLTVFAYTVNEKEDMKMLLDWGVSGMFTNYPDRLYEVLKEKSDNLKH